MNKCCDYKHFVLSATQVGDNHPTFESVGVNTLGDYVFLRLGVGFFLIQSDGLFLDGRTQVLMNNTWAGQVNISAQVINVNLIAVSVTSNSGMPVDGRLNGEIIEVKVYEI